MKKQIKIVDINNAQEVDVEVDVEQLPITLSTIIKGYKAIAVLYHPDVTVMWGEKVQQPRRILV